MAPETGVKVMHRAMVCIKLRSFFDAAKLPLNGGLMGGCGLIHRKQIRHLQPSAGGHGGTPIPMTSAIPGS